MGKDSQEKGGAGRNEEKNEMRNKKGGSPSDKVEVGIEKGRKATEKEIIKSECYYQRAPREFFLSGLQDMVKKGEKKGEDKKSGQATDSKNKTNK